MTAGSEILQYRGDAGLGLGSNADIPAIYSDNNVINQTNRDLMMINHENNVIKYKQKLADRDKELAALDAGQVETGAILDRDRPVLDKLQKDADKEFFNMVAAGGLNNKEAYRKYEGKIKELKDATTWAQHRYLGRNKVKAEKSNQTLKADQEAYDKYLNDEDSKPFYSGQYLGRQKALDYDADKITETGWKDVLGTPITSTTNKEVIKTAPNGQKTITDTKTTVPVKGGKAVAGTVSPTTEVVTGTVKRNGKTYQVTQSQIDFNKIRNNQIAAYADAGGADFENQQLHRKAIDALPEESYVPYMSHILQRVNDYNTDKGLKEGSEGYIDPKLLAQKLGVDHATGKRTGNIMLSTPDFAAFTALADYNGSYAPKSESFNKEESEFDLKAGESKAKIGAINALAGERRAKTALTNKKGALLDNQFNPAQTFDELFKGKIKTTETGNGTKIPRVNVSDMPKSFLDNLGIDPINSNGDYNVVPSNIKFKGKDIPQDDALKLYNNWLKTPDAKALQKKLSKEPDLFDFVYANGGDFEVEVIGKVRPEYKTGADGTRTLTNPKEAGKVVRSNRLQSWINQRKQEGIKGDKLLMEQPAAEDGSSITE